MKEFESGTLLKGDEKFCPMFVKLHDLSVNNREQAKSEECTATFFGLSNFKHVYSINFTQ
jgi:hypothetical protein